MSKPLFSLLLLILAGSGPVASPAARGGEQAGQAAIDARFSRALELQQKGAWKEAEREYRAVLAAAPGYAEAHANLGAILMRQDRYTEAIRSYSTALKLDPRLTPVLLNLGIAHYRKGEFGKAVDALRRFLAVAPGNAQAVHLSALALVELGRDNEALDYLDRALQASPTDPALIYATGLVCLRQNKPKVEEIIQTLAAVPGGLPSSRLLKGQRLLKQSEYEKAVVELQSAAAIDPNLPRLQFSLGYCYYRLGRAREATAAIEAELKRSPKDFSTLYYAACLREESGNIGEARTRIEQALAIEPESAVANALLGKILLKEGNAQAALKPLEASVAQDPEAPDARYILGRVYQQLGRKEDALREFNESKRLRELQLQKHREQILGP